MLGPLIIIIIFKVPKIDHQQYFTLFVIHSFFSFLKQIKFNVSSIVVVIMSEPYKN